MRSSPARCGREASSLHHRRWRYRTSIRGAPGRSGSVGATDAGARRRPSLRPRVRGDLPSRPGACNTCSKHLNGANACPVRCESPTRSGGKERTTGGTRGLRWNRRSCTVRRHTPLGRDQPSQEREFSNHLTSRKARPCPTWPPTVPSVSPLRPTPRFALGSTSPSPPSGLSFRVVICESSGSVAQSASDPMTLTA